MSEPITCPQCGATAAARKTTDFEESVKLRCQSCGALFEYIPGFGAFSLSDDEQRSTLGGGFPGSQMGGADYRYESDMEMQPGSGSGAGAVIACCLLLTFILPLLYAMFLIIGP